MSEKSFQHSCEIIYEINSVFKEVHSNRNTKQKEYTPEDDKLKHLKSLYGQTNEAGSLYAMYQSFYQMALKQI